MSPRLSVSTIRLGNGRQTYFTQCYGCLARARYGRLLVSRARPFTNSEGRKESGQIQYTILLCTVSNLRKEGRDYDVIIHHEFRKNLRSRFLSATWQSRNMIIYWRRLFKRVGGGLETAFWSESVGNFSSATPASTWPRP